MSFPQVRHSSLLAIAMVIAAVVLPLCVVLPRPAHTVSEYVFEAELEEFLGKSTNGQLTYFAASTLHGDAPAESVVLSFDKAYTRGSTPTEFKIGSSYWVEGSLMTPEVYFGQQYIFYGPPQLYLRQIKTGALWPDQVTELRVLYLSPLSTLAAPIQLPLLFRSDSLSARIAIALGLRCILVAAVLVWSVRRHRSRASVTVALSLYALVAIVLSLPVLGDLY